MNRTILASLCMVVVSSPALAFTLPDIDPVAVREPVVLTAVPSSGDPQSCGTNREFHRDDAAGLQNSKPFVVPDGYVFVATDISWTAKPAAGQFDPNLSVLATIYAQSPAMPGPGYQFEVPADRVTSLIATGNTSLNQGVTYVAGTTFCLSAMTSNVGPATPWRGRVYGYLVPAMP